MQKLVLISGTELNESGYAYPADLVPSKPLVGAATGEVCQNLWATDCIFQFAAVTSGGGVLPDRGALEGESGGGQLLGQAFGGVEVGEELFGLSRPEYRAMLLRTLELVRIRGHLFHDVAHLTVTGDSQDATKAYACGLHFVHDEVHSL